MNAEMTDLLEEKVVVVVGVGEGLGRAIAEQCCHHGADVALGARSEDYLKSLADELAEATGRGTFGHHVDIGEPAAVTAFRDAVLDRFGRVDTLVLNAADDEVLGSLEGGDIDRWRRQMDLNVMGSMRVVQAFAGDLKAGRGSVVFTDSMIVDKVLPTMGSYAMTKGALRVGARTLARELGAEGVRVNSVAPGWMWGASVEQYMEGVERDTGVTVAEQKDAIAAQFALPDWPTEVDCANAVVFLASPLASSVTGVCLDVNAGELFR